ncbi:MAG TPA: hypothetical protein VFB54_16600 [Burkholderiales bacterium]|nr:hypothetical protein [Burkholderiales bacterium]
MKQISVSRCLGLAAAIALVASTALQAASADDETDSTQNRIRKGFKLAPVPLDLHGKNRALVGLGSYIVNAQGGCNDCHTNPPYLTNPFAGDPIVVNKDQYLAGGVPFGPGIVSKNLTPDANGRPAGLTLDEFVNAIRTGRDPDDPNHILQVMPWPVFRNMVDIDLRAIYEYLRSIPSRPNNY